MPVNSISFAIPTVVGDEMFICGIGSILTLDTGGSRSRNEPETKCAPTNIMSISTGYGHSVALGYDGSLWSWGIVGTPYFGTVHEIIPTRIPHMRSFVSVSAGFAFTLALDSQGNVWSFGLNNHRQLGLGDQEYRSVPEMINTIPPIKAIAAGNDYALVLSTDGVVWSFGDNSKGQLGFGDNKTRLAPSALRGVITPYPDIVDISCGFDHSLILCSGGTVWSFGSNSRGQLGLGFADDIRHSPSLIRSLHSVRRVLCGIWSSYVQRISGSVLVFGNNTSSQLGFQNTSKSVDYCTPIKNPIFKDSRLIVGGFHVLSVDQQGDVRFYGALCSNEPMGHSLEPQPKTELGINIGTPWIPAKSAMSAVRATVIE